MLTVTSLASALSAITAQNFGAGKPERGRKSLWLSLAFALALRIPLIWYVGSHFTSNSQDIGILGTIAPTVSGIMAAYTLFYVSIEGRKKSK